MKEQNKKIMIIGIIIFIIMFFIVLFYLFFPKIKLNGRKIVDIELGETYIDEGYKVESLIGGLEKKVTVTSNIDKNKIGIYKIKYEISIFMFKIKEYRTVNVIDNIPPELTLKGNQLVEICPNRDYEEEGYQAIDNYDGDITIKVDMKRVNDNIIYTVNDSSNNKSEIIRTIKKVDSLAPTITLNGNETQYIYKGDAYNEYGAKAIDNCDDDLTDKIQISGTVDTSLIGTYEILYKVKDNSGNESSRTRYVKVINKIDYSASTIYLTFDDGPSANITPKILDILKEEGVKATFFVINADDSLNYIIKRAYDEGHTIALHSFSHNYAKIYSSEEAYFNDLNEIKNKVKSITGEEPKIIRFPGGTSNTVSRKYNSGIMSRLSKEVINRGYIYFDWNVSSGDAGNASTADKVYNNVIAGLSSRKTNVVLMHDSSAKTYTLNALRNIIRYGKEKGYKFDRITTSTPQIKHMPQN